MPPDSAEQKFYEEMLGHVVARLIKESMSEVEARRLAEKALNSPEHD